MNAMTKMLLKLLLKIPFAIVLLALTACATSSPVVYRNQALPTVSESQLRQDIAQCETQAGNAGLKPNSGPGGDVTRDTVRGGALGGATGAVSGAIGGNAGRGAKYGAAAGATAGLIRSIFKDSKPNSTYRRYVERCLTDLGHDVVGWD
jgi:uncharacterized protein YcfJ